MCEALLGKLQDNCVGLCLGHGHFPEGNANSDGCSTLKPSEVLSVQGLCRAQENLSRARQNKELKDSQTGQA